MKKIQILLLLSALLALLTGCGAAPERPAETTETAVADGYDVLGGTWTVCGIILEDRILDVKDLGLEDMYDSELLMFGTDGRFSHWLVSIGEGDYFPYRENEYLLTTDYVYWLKYKDGESVQEECDSVLLTYLVTVLDENTLRLSEFDPLLGKPAADDMPQIFVRYGEESRWLRENKMQIG